jgi:hypothetical protein
MFLRSGEMRKTWLSRAGKKPPGCKKPRSGFQQSRSRARGKTEVLKKRGAGFSKAAPANVVKLKC